MSCHIIYSKNIKIIHAKYVMRNYLVSIVLLLFPWVFWGQPYEKCTFYFKLSKPFLILLFEFSCIFRRAPVLTVAGSVLDKKSSKMKSFKEQRYIASVCHIISLIEFRKSLTQSKCINCIGIQNNNILKKLFHTFIQTVILKLVMLNYG